MNKKSIIIFSLATFAIIAGTKIASSRFRNEDNSIIPLSEYIEMMEEKHGKDLQDGVDDAIEKFNSKIENT